MIQSSVQSELGNKIAKVIVYLGAAHADLTRVAAILRDTGVDVWTETPSDEDVLAGRTGYSLAGWRAHFKRNRSWLNTVAVEHGAFIRAVDASLATALTGYLSSTATLGTAFNTLINAAAYRDGSGNLIQRTVTQAHRNALADAIEAELA